MNKYKLYTENYTNICYNTHMIEYYIKKNKKCDVYRYLRPSTILKKKNKNCILKKRFLVNERLYEKRKYKYDSMKSYVIYIIIEKRKPLSSQEFQIMFLLKNKEAIIYDFIKERDEY